MSPTHDTAAPAGPAALTSPGRLIRSPQPCAWTQTPGEPPVPAPCGSTRGNVPAVPPARAPTRTVGETHTNLGCILPRILWWRQRQLVGRADGGRAERIENHQPGWGDRSHKGGGGGGSGEEGEGQTRASRATRTVGGWEGEGMAATGGWVLPQGPPAVWLISRCHLGTSCPQHCPRGSDPVPSDPHPSQPEPALTTISIPKSAKSAAPRVLFGVIVSTRAQVSGVPA